MHLNKLITIPRNEKKINLFNINKNLMPIIFYYRNQFEILLKEVSRLSLAIIILRYFHSLF